MVVILMELCRKSSIVFPCAPYRNGRIHISCKISAIFY